MTAIIQETVLLETIYTRIKQRVTLRNYNRSNKLRGGGGGGGLKRVLLDSKPSPFASAVVQNIWSA